MHEASKSKCAQKKFGRQDGERLEMKYIGPGRAVRGYHTTRLLRPVLPWRFGAILSRQNDRTRDLMIVYCRTTCLDQMADRSHGTGSP
jgi:hypothetical protein